MGTPSARHCSRQAGHHASVVRKMSTLETLPRQAVANHLAVEDVEGGKQRRSPVPLVVVRLALR